MQMKVFFDITVTSHLKTKTVILSKLKKWHNFFAKINFSNKVHQHDINTKQGFKITHQLVKHCGGLHCRQYDVITQIFKARKTFCSLFCIKKAIMQNHLKNFI